MALTLQAPAKINLCLRVVGRRPDGYHLLESLFVPVGLCDTLTLEAIDSGLKLSCPDSDLPADETNLAWRAADAFFRTTGLEGGLRLELRKRIPLAAGLGGGSSDAAAVLAGANRLYGWPLDQTRLRELALTLGADVPFFIDPHPALVSGIGEIIEPIDFPNYHYLLINPGFEVSTAQVFSALQKPLTAPEGVDTIGQPVIGSYRDLLSLDNDLEPVVTEKWPTVGRIRDRLMAAGAVLARMSGSGPTVFGLFETPEQAEAGRKSIEPESGWRVFTAIGLS